jgi:hypothetical protein
VIRPYVKTKHKTIKENRISIQSILNFIGAHPRLISLMAGIGISFTFSFVGKTMIHEILQPAYALVVVFCHNCGASEFSPGHEAVSSGDAQNFAPGHEANSETPAKDFAPGHEFKKGLK